MPSLLVLPGILLLGLLALDVFVTVFHASGHAGPVTRRQNRLLWAGFRAVGIRSDGTSRERLLAFGGPTLVATTLLVWVGWLVLGYFLLYLPFISSFLVSPGSLRTPWMEALYYSMYTAGTVGLGDVIADAEALRVLTGLQAMSGFALFSLSITYLLSVYGELISARATASGISGYFAEGMAATLRRVEEARPEAFARWAEGITTALLRTTQAQFQYPVLNYFYSADRSRALPVQVGRLLEICRGPNGPRSRTRSGLSAVLSRTPACVGGVSLRHRGELHPGRLRGTAAEGPREPKPHAAPALHGIR